MMNNNYSEEEYNEAIRQVEQLIESNKMGEMPDLCQIGGRDAVFQILTQDQKKMQAVLGMLTFFVDGKYIRLFGKLAEYCIKYKKMRKAFIINIGLDILHYLGWTKYLEVKEDSIVIKIIDDTFATDINRAKEDLIAKQKERELFVDKYYKELQAFKDYEMKDWSQHDYTTTPEFN